MLRVDEKFGIQERVLDYNSDEEANSKTHHEVGEVFIETNDNLQNEIQIVERREEPRAEVEITTPKRNLTKNHPVEQIIGSKDKGVMPRNHVHEEVCLISQVEPNNAVEAYKDDHWIQAMKEQLDQIIKNDTRELVPRPNYKNVIGTRWVFRNKMNEQGEVVRNKARLVCKGYSEQEGIGYEEKFAPVARTEAVRVLLANAIHKKFKVYQIDVKSTYLNGELEEEVYIEQPEGFSLTEDKDVVCKLKKELYGLKQAPRAWYARLDKYLTK